MHTYKLIMAGLLSVLLVSCTGMGEKVETYGLPIAGAAAGSTFGDSTQEKVIGAAVGGIGGAVVGQLAFGDKHKQKYYDAGVNEGYQRGVGDAWKRQYWGLQQGQSGINPHGEMTIQQIDIPQTKTADGRFLMPRQINVPTIQ